MTVKIIPIQMFTCNNPTCGHQWTKKPKDLETEGLPVKCPKCKVKNWNGVVIKRK